MGSGRNASGAEPVQNSLRSLAYGTLFGVLSALLISMGLHFIVVKIPLACKDLVTWPLSSDTWIILNRTIGFGKLNSNRPAV